jgi:hypothetical protein
VFNFSLMPRIDKLKKAPKNCQPGDNKPTVTNSFMPFGMDYHGGLSLATGWVTGPLGGAESIVVGQTNQPGQVKLYSSGSKLQGGPAIYLTSAEHSPIPIFTEIASFTPFHGTSGVSVATTSTTTGADVLVSGVSDGNTARVEKFRFVRPTDGATTLVAQSLREVLSTQGSSLVVLGGD